MGYHHGLYRQIDSWWIEPASSKLKRVGCSTRFFCHVGCCTGLAWKLDNWFGMETGHTIELAPLMCYDHCINTGSRKAERDAQSDPNNLIRIMPAEGCAASTKNTLPAEGVF